MQKLKVVELFAGVGCFRIGLENTGFFQVVWSNQWEPGNSKQHASNVYEHRFGTKGHSNEDIETVSTSKIPNHEVLVGGFPCQDYSVASLLKNSKGLLGKKGVLWWSIYRILEQKKVKPKYLILENVDRLLASPATQKGRDFGVMLSSLNNLGYAVEWRVINAGEYGMPQRRRRVFILGYHKNSRIYKQLKTTNFNDWIFKDGVIARQFKVEQSNTLFIPDEIILNTDLKKVSKNFNNENTNKIFKNSGIMIDGKVITTQVKPDYKGKRTLLRDIIENKKVDDEFYIDKKDLKRWKKKKVLKARLKTDLLTNGKRVH